MDIDHDYDPLSALGVRISTPAETDFLRANIRLIEGEHGTPFAADLVRAISMDDFDAAKRVAAALCQEVDFTPCGEREFEWRQGDASGKTSLNRGSQAKALVVTAINARYAILRVAATPSP